MKTNIVNRWIIAGLIWLGAVFLTYWNGKVIDRTDQTREKEEVLKLGEQFIKRRPENIPRILKKAEGLYQAVEAPKLGLLSIEKELHTLATKFGLNEVQMSTDPSLAGESTISISVGFNGFLKGAVAWLAAIEKDYPYLVVTQVKTVNAQAGNKINVDVSLKYRYRIISPARPT